MTKRIVAVLLLLCSFLAYSNARVDEHALKVAERNAAQGFNDTIDRLVDDFVTVSLCIADPTDQTQDFLGITGHSFLRLQCPKFGLDYCFSYESERIKGQLWDYISGRLKMGMFAAPTDEYLEDYRIWQRAVHEYHLSLPAEAKLRLWEQMDNHLMEEREMQMDLFKFGCTSTILRYVEKALQPDVITYNWPEKYLEESVITLAGEHLQYHPWIFFGMRIIAGRQLRALNMPKQKIVFPTDLLEVWSSATIDGTPVLAYAGDIVEAEPPVYTKPWFTPQLCGILLLVIIIAIVVWRVVVRRRKTYPLLPFSQLVYEIIRWMPKIYTFTIDFRVKGVSKQDALAAIKMGFENHPVFRTRVDCRGRQYYKPETNVLKGSFHSVKVCEQNNQLQVSVRMNRILGDEYGMGVLLDDIIRAYMGMPLEKDDYFGYLEYIEQQKQSKYYADSKNWLVEQFEKSDIPVRPTIDRKCVTTLLPPKAGVLEADYTDLRGGIQHLAQTDLLNMDGFFSLCTALAIADYCGTETAALTWAYKGREKAEEQRVFGSLHKDVPFKISRSDDRKQLIKQARNQIRSGIAHSDYPYTLTAPYNKRWNYAVNVLRVADWQTLLQDTPVDVEILPIKPLRFAYAMLDVEIHESEQSLKLCFRYSATHYREESMQRFSGLVRHYAEWLTA